MTADAQFNRWMRRAAVLFVLVFGYIMVADVTIPMTPHSMVQRPVVAIAPRVSGEVIQVAVTNNQQVAQGDVLFTIDPRDYEIAVEKAQLALSEAKQENENLQAQLAKAEATVVQATVNHEETVREQKRLKTLLSQNLVSQQLVDQMSAQVDSAAAELQAAIQSKRSIQVQLGEQGDENLRVRIAQNQLRQAELNLSRTTVTAADDGFISNLQLTRGVQAQANQPLMSLVVTGKERIAADFREKSLNQISQAATALVVFDALPGKVFTGRLTSKDFGIAEGQLSADGKLAQPEESDRWVRDAQRVRVYIALQDAKLPPSLVTGARATVLLEKSSSGFFHWLGKTQMTIVSLLHYVY
ncbi:HlyD family secretion protein [Alteromonas pelagimontana]|uniref:HlyD family secretion protein n=1 Tax=Alteromonas pelagimontana TaxID=1858656 RepID=A0A6M4MC96_9ALTE|nr:HlyD family secretion protein [Alteromonas pelagimontana]QJR80669.1 HlyD family secretion protein [Alteromonas pelagimontana]